MPRGGQCHCRSCQRNSGGGPNYFVLVRQEDFQWTKGEPASFSLPDKPDAVTREFCATCSTQVSTLRPGQPKRIVKVGTFDDPGAWPGPGFAIFTAEKAPWHLIPEGLPAFEGLPG